MRKEIGAKQGKRGEKEGGKEEGRREEERSVMWPSIKVYR